METLELLDRLVGFDTVSARTNLPLIDYAEDHLGGLGFETIRFPDPDGPKAGLLARLGSGGGGLLLAAHSDVVPVEGQAWTRPPFRLTREGDRLYGRGTTDMKGFLAAMLAAAERAAARSPVAPLSLLISYDEEIGCRGLGRMMDRLRPHLGRPRLAIVGEPTGMRVATGHKGKMAWRAIATGEAGHSAAAPSFVNALHLVGDLMTRLRGVQDEISRTGARDAAYAVPHATIHVGTLSGGTALNLVPERAEMTFELRHLPADGPRALSSRIAAEARSVAAAHGPGGTLSLEPLCAYPAFEAEPAATSLARDMLGPDTVKVGFGTEAGLLAAEGLPTVVWGPGSMDAQGHKPDEYLDRTQLAACDEALDRAMDRLL